MQFNNLNELTKHFNSFAGLKTIMSQENVKKALISEGERLHKYLVEEIDDYYQDPTYKPQEYQRTGRWLESIKVNPPIQIGNTFSMSITFDENLANHPSWIGQEDGYVPWLMEVGWNISGKFNGEVNRFTEFEGTHYIYRACQRWNRDNKFGFTISVYHGGARYI